MSTPAGTVVSILIQLAPGHPPSGPRKTMLLSITSIEALAHDCDAVQSPSSSASAGFANKAKTIAGAMINHLLRN